MLLIGNTKTHPEFKSLRGNQTVSTAFTLGGLSSSWLRGSYYPILRPPILFLSIAQAQPPAMPTFGTIRNHMYTSVSGHGS
jgi:hypothetical protein